VGEAVRQRSGLREKEEAPGGGFNVKSAGDVKSNKKSGVSGIHRTRLSRTAKSKKKGGGSDTSRV